MNLKAQDESEDYFWYQCAACAQLMKPSFFGDVYGGIQWSDGYATLDDDVNLIPVYQCPKCQGIHWLDRSIRNQKDASPPPPPGAPEVRPPGELSLLEAIDHGLASDGSREFIARRLAWWRMNDACRWHNRRPLPPPHQLAVRNMEWLLDHVRASGPPGKLSYRRAQDFIEIELLRNLARFDEAVERLTAIAGGLGPGPDHRSARSFCDYWRRLCQARDARVRPISKQDEDAIEEG